MKVLNFGSLNLDYVYNVEHFVREGETLSSTDMNTFCGGKGLNQSVALARAGAAVCHAGAVGRSDGTALIEILNGAGVDTSYIDKYDMPSGHAIIQKNTAGNNCILLYGGANQNISKEFIDEVLRDFGDEDVLLLQNEISNIDYLIERGYEKGMHIVLNPSPINEKIFECDLGKVEYLVLNEIEAGDILERADQKNTTSEKTDIDDAGMALRLSNMFDTTKILLTLGEKGSVYVDKEHIYRQDIFKTEVVDTTAAGDTFTGFFIAGMAAGRDVESDMRFAAKASSIAVSRRGAAPSIPTMEEVIKALEK